MFGFKKQHNKTKKKATRIESCGKRIEYHFNEYEFYLWPGQGLIIVKIWVLLGLCLGKKERIADILTYSG